MNTPSDPKWSFRSPTNLCRAVVEAERLNFGYLFNPSFATETSLIDPLPHQRIAVYEQMLPQARLRLLLADDAGAGKTIMAGLYLREMLARKLIRRVLIVPPAGLVGNWKRELETLFGLRFKIANGANSRRSNPFTGELSDLIIISVDTLRSENTFKRLQEVNVNPYDLVIFDECHKLGCDQRPDETLHKTDRYRLAEALAGIPSEKARWQLPWASHHLLLLSATPHMGKDYPYYALWRLLEPQVLTTWDAFANYPADSRQKHFLRRTKEEMVYFDGSRLYPQRRSDTLSYSLSQGEISEQSLYDATTDYLQTIYNQAGILNKAAAAFAISIFQRRLASSTYALLRSFQRRQERLGKLVSDIRSKRISATEILRLQRELSGDDDLFDSTTGDEEGSTDGEEANQHAEDKVLAQAVSQNLSDLEIELHKLNELARLAQGVYDSGLESKFEKFRQTISDPAYAREKIIVFTEHKDTLNFIIARLEALGFTGRIAQIHGGMNYTERDAQVEHFRKSHDDGGSQFLICTDAAGEGINLQFCWIMVNWDIPWNPARLEQRMGRIHRYKQKRDVVIMNLIASNTREGRVVQTLLEKLESIRKQLGSDKVFDVVGRLIEGVSIRDYLRECLTDPAKADPQAQLSFINSTITAEQVKALEERDKRIYGDGGDVKSRLPELKAQIDRESWRKQLPSNIRNLLLRSSELLDFTIEGDIDTYFRIRPGSPATLPIFQNLLASYPPHCRDRLTIHRPADASEAIFLYPGERLFESIREELLGRFAAQALEGATLIDPTATEPYLVHLGLATVVRQADPDHPRMVKPETRSCELIALSQTLTGKITPLPPDIHNNLIDTRQEQSLEVFAGPFQRDQARLIEQAVASTQSGILTQKAEAIKAAIEATLQDRSTFVSNGFDYQQIALLSRRQRLRQTILSGETDLQSEFQAITSQIETLPQRRQEALDEIDREPQLIRPGPLHFIAHLLVLPTTDPLIRKRFDADIEQIAMQYATQFEQARGSTVIDVSTADKATAAGLAPYPGFDLLIRHPKHGEFGVEVKGRAAIGEVELTENEWSSACNQRHKFWLYVVFDCAAANPRLHRLQDPWGNKLGRTQGGVVIDAAKIRHFAAND